MVDSFLCLFFTALHSRFRTYITANVHRDWTMISRISGILSSPYFSRPFSRARESSCQGVGFWAEFIYLYSAAVMAPSPPDRPLDINAAQAFFSRNNSHHRRSSPTDPAPQIQQIRQTRSGGDVQEPQFRQIFWSSSSGAQQQQSPLQQIESPPLSPRQQSSLAYDVHSPALAQARVTQEQSKKNNVKRAKQKRSNMTEPRTRAARHKGHLNFPSECMKCCCSYEMAPSTS